MVQWLAVGKVSYSQSRYEHHNNEAAPIVSNIAHRIEQNRTRNRLLLVDAFLCRCDYAVPRYDILSQHLNDPLLRKMFEFSVLRLSLTGLYPNSQPLSHCYSVCVPELHHSCIIKVSLNYFMLSL